MILPTLVLAATALAAPPRSIHKRGVDPIYDGAQVNGKTYDYVIVGGGLSGSVLAARLTEDATKQVLVIEAGYNEEGRANVTDASKYQSTFDTWLDWAWKTVAQPEVGGQQLTIRGGRGLGGSTLINGMAWSKPETYQIDAMASVGNDGLNWNSLQTYMLRAENFQTPTSAQLENGLTYEDSARGRGGPIATQHEPLGVPAALDKTFKQTVLDYGLPDVKDLTAGNPAGVAPISHTSNNGLRSDAYRGYLLGKDKPNLTILSGANAGKVILNDEATPKATGVEFRDEKGTLFVVNAGLEVIVSTGSVKTPLLLQHSGIGPKAVLENAGVPLRVDTPAGQNLIDQITTTSSWSFSGARGGGQVILWPRFQDLFKDGDADTMRNMLTNDLESYVQDAVSHGAASNAEGLRAVLEIQRDWVLQKNAGISELFDYSYDTTLGYDSWYLLPFGRGSVNITNNDAYSQGMSLDPRFLSNAFDRLASGATARFSRTVSQSSPLKDSITGENTPGSAVNGNDLETWATWVASNSRSNWHPIGTAPMMAQNLGGVVDSRHNVYGTKGLRVVDGSNLPFQVSSHLMSVLYGFAERAADLIKQDNTGTNPPTTPSSSVPPPTPSPSSNPTHRAIHPNGDNTQCLEVTNGAFNDGTSVTVANCNDSPQQRWEISATSAQVKVAGQNFCLDAGSNPANGIGMKIWTCYDNLAAQSWTFANDNIKLQSADQCIDRQDGATGVQTWQCYDGNTNQRWTV